MLAVIVAFGVVYNSARIALSERSRELATLRVVGFSLREVAGVLLGELAILVLLALPAGLLFGRGLALFIMSSFSTETVRMPLVINPSTYSIAVARGAHRRRALLRRRQPDARQTRPGRRAESPRLTGWRILD